MTKSIKLFSGVLILMLFSSTSNAGSITKCVDAAGNITFTSMGCKTSETDVQATEEAKARVAAEEKAKAEAKAEEEAAIQRATATKTSTSSTSTSQTNTTAAVSSNTPETSAIVHNESGNKTGMRGSINSDLTIGYQ